VTHPSFTSWMVERHYSPRFLFNTLSHGDRGVLKFSKPYSLTGLIQLREFRKELLVMTSCLHQTTLSMKLFTKVLLVLDIPSSPS
jgi:hypothetical protein